MKTKWNTKNIDSQKGRIILITGANSGLGLGTAKALAMKGAHIVLAVRNMDKGAFATKELLKEIPNAKVDLLKVDLSDLNSVRSFADRFKSKYDKLDVLINNAGVMMTEDRFQTMQGFEGHLGTNHLGHFVLTKELIDLIGETENSRIVTLSSVYAKMKPADIYWDDLQFEKKYNKEKAYAQSKLANMMFGVMLNKKLYESGSKTISILAHPGYTATNLQRHMGLIGKVMNFLIAQKIEMGILPVLRAATDVNVKGGEYYGPEKMSNWRGYPVINTLADKALDDNELKKLWKISEELTQTNF
ncbi:oxidoreductase [Reichenbachiella versicolor]|uniref:oxidoreductase n=1 Tax=Reichenbachiella versicolor TaxID=1821036 RepID=UPI000D6DD78B|nr:oxidoreductase [Reichenbachiella versicolor]